MCVCVCVEGEVLYGFAKSSLVKYEFNVVFKL